MNPVKKYREDRKISPIEFAKQCGISKATLFRIEGDYGHLAKFETMILISNITKITLDELARACA